MKLINVPEYSGKISLEQLKDVPNIPFDPSNINEKETAFFSTKESGLQFDFLWHPKKGSNRLFVLFSGDAPREKYAPPVFQRWSWANMFPGHCLFVSDPALYMHKSLGLAWYVGNEAFDTLPFIATTVQAIANNFSLRAEEIISYGSSGGGFAALRLGAFLPGIGIAAINPQTVVTNYRLNKVERLLQVCFKGKSREEALEQFPKRLSILANIDKLSSSKIIYVQNTLDVHHYEEHYKPFVNLIESNASTPRTAPFNKITFEHEGGHLKAETSDVFTKIVSLVQG